MRRLDLALRVRLCFALIGLFGSPVKRVGRDDARLKQFGVGSQDLLLVTRLVEINVHLQWYVNYGRLRVLQVESAAVCSCNPTIRMRNPVP